MYLALLTLHSWLRWVVLGFGLAAAAKAVRGHRQGDAHTADRLALAFVVSLDLQLTLGLTLYTFLSPLGAPALRDVGAIMHTSVLRFWAIEHPTGMLLAFVLAHVGQVLVRRTQDDVARARRRLWWSVVPLLAIMLTIPWPFMAYGRPLFRW